MNTGYISSLFSRNSEAYASEFQENDEEIIAVGLVERQSTYREYII